MISKTMKTGITILSGIPVFYFAYININHWEVEKQADFGSFICLLLLFAFILSGLFLLLESLRIISSKQYLNFNILLFSVALSLFAGEIILRRFDDSIKTYSERNFKIGYESPYYLSLQKCDSCAGHSLYVHQPNSTGAEITGEFAYRMTYNSYGLRDNEFHKEKDTLEFRILGLGDSFTEGSGTSSDSTWLKQLEEKLNANSKSLHFTSLNGGVAGSDLFFSYALLKECLFKYRPDLVILNLNSTDVNDVIYRGGNDRFNSHGIFMGKTGPWWEFIFGASYVVRAVAFKVFHLNWQLLTDAGRRVENEKSIHQISEKINEFEALARKEGFNFLLVLQPMEYELTGLYNPLSELKFDTGVNSIDLTPSFKAKIAREPGVLDKYYWPVNGHFKAFGYGAMADEIYCNYFLKQARFSLPPSHSD